MKVGEWNVMRNETRIRGVIFQLKLRLIVKLWIQMNCNCNAAHAIIDPIWNICVVDTIRSFKKRKKKKNSTPIVEHREAESNRAKRFVHARLLHARICTRTHTSDCSVNEIPITRFLQWPPLSGVIRTGTELFYNRPFLPCNLSNAREYERARPRYYKCIL